MIDPRRLLTFREVALQRSFSRAADKLMLTQSAVSQQVTALERGLGVQLLTRGRGGVQLTQAGALLLDHALALAERLQIADSQLAELAHENQRALRVGAFPSALATIVPAALTRLLTSRPALEVDVREGSREELENGLRDGGLHLAVCFQDKALPRLEPPGLIRDDLMEEPMVVALPPRHRLAGRRTIALPELAEDSWTAPSRDGLIRRACVAAGFEPHITIVTRDPLAVRAVVHAGLAVALAPRLLGSLLSGLRIVPVSHGAPLRTIFALTPDFGRRPVELELLDELRRAGDRDPGVAPN